MKGGSANTICDAVVEDEEYVNMVNDNNVPEREGLVFGVEPGIMSSFQELSHPGFRIIITIDERNTLRYINML